MQSKRMKIFVLNLEKWRIEHNISQIDFANKLEMSRATYCRLISGEKDNMDVDTLLHVYNVTGLLCHMLMEVYSDDFLRLTKITRSMNSEELSFMLYTAQNLILMKEGKLGGNRL